MKKIAIIFSFFFLFSLFPQASFAAKMLPQAKSVRKSTEIKKSAGSFLATPRLRRDRKALLVYFGNLQNTQSVSYMLIYKTNGQDEGAGGSVNSAQGNSANRELLFGTCSKNVCRYNSNITEMKFEVTAKLKSGKTTIKRYKIRV